MWCQFTVALSSLLVMVFAGLLVNLCARDLCAGSDFAGFSNGVQRVHECKQFIRQR